MSAQVPETLAAEPPQPSPTTAPTASDSSVVGVLARTRALDYGVVISLLLLFVALAIASGPFLTKANLLNVLEANAGVGIAACGGTLVIIAGGLDVSVGAIFAVGAVVAAKLTIATGSAAVGIAAGIGAGAVLGLFNGLTVTVGGANPFVATLASGIMFQSLAQVISSANLLTPTESSYTDLGRGQLLGVKYSIWLFAIVALISGFLLARTRFGRRVKVVGGNREAARLSGVRVGRVRCLTFVLSGLTAAIAGVIVSSRSGQADANLGGTAYVLSVIAAIAIGGTSLRGGEGAIWRTVIGVLFLGLVTNGLNLLNVKPTYYQLFTGLLILLALGVDALARRLRDPGG